MEKDNNCGSRTTEDHPKAKVVVVMVGQPRMRSPSPRVSAESIMGDQRQSLRRSARAYSRDHRCKMTQNGAMVLVYLCIGFAAGSIRRRRSRVLVLVSASRAASGVKPQTRCRCSSLKWRNGEQTSRHRRPPSSSVPEVHQATTAARSTG